MNLYRVLGVPSSISQRELKTVYRRLAKATHPDHNPDDPEAHERFKRISEAWAVLGDEWHALGRVRSARLFAVTPAHPHPHPRTPHRRPADCANRSGAGPRKLERGRRVGVHRR